MNRPSLQLIEKIDNLTRSNKSFAIYRLPWTETPLLVMQESESMDTVYDIKDLNGKKGFVISPFHITEKHPAIIVKPEITASGWDEIEENIGHIEVKNSSCQNTQPDTFDNEPKLKEKYISTFLKFITPLKENEFKKLVLSRKAVYRLKENFSPLLAFLTACNNYPRMMISLTHTPISGTWIGSTPEIILSGNGKEWRTVSLAGTMPMNGNAMPENWTEKNKEEQALVSLYIKDILKKVSKKVTVSGPYTVQAGQLAHLKTDFKFILDKTSRLGEILKELYPTPAICGLPKDNAYRFIIDNEGYDRGYYSGIIGWLDPDGETNLYVNLRCANVSESGVTYYAGGGILPLSDASSEWEETQHKMNTMKRCLNETV